MHSTFLVRSVRRARVGGKGIPFNNMHPKKTTEKRARYQRMFSVRLLNSIFRRQFQTISTCLTKRLESSSTNSGGLK